MKNFSFKRFWIVLRSEYTMRRPMWLGLFIVIVAALLILDLNDNLWNYPFLIGVKYGMIYFPVLCSIAMFATIGSNKTLATQLMMPASNAEKFLAKFVSNVVVPLLISFVGIWFLPVELIDNNGELLVPTHWEYYRIHFCITLCLTGIMMLMSMINSKYSADNKKAANRLGLVVGLLTPIGTFVYIQIINNYTPGSFYNFMMENSTRVTVFQLALGLSVLAICSAICYRIYKNLTLK